MKLGKFGKELAKRNKERSVRFVEKLKPVLLMLKRKGFKTARSIAGELNRRKIKTYSKGGLWHISTIYYLLNRIQAQKI